MTKELREQLQGLLVDQVYDGLRDSVEYQAEDLVKGWDDQSLVNEYLLGESDDEQEWRDNFADELANPNSPESQLAATPQFRRHWHPPDRRWTLVYMPSGDMADLQQFEDGHEPVLGKVWHDGGDGTYLAMHEDVEWQTLDMKEGDVEVEIHTVYLLSLGDGISYLAGQGRDPQVPIVALGPWERWPK